MKSALIDELFDSKEDKENKKESDTAVLYRAILGKCRNTGKPHELVKAVMDGFDADISAAIKGKAAKDEGQMKKNWRGSVFEYIIGEILILYGIKPLYHQAKVRHVPLAKFDWLLYHPECPVSISCKTSARERWKQAAYEGMALKRVYPQAVNYLVMIERLANTDQKKKEAPQSLDHFVIAIEPDFDEAIADIAQTEYKKAESMSQVLDSSVLIS